MLTLSILVLGWVVSPVCISTLVIAAVVGGLLSGCVVLVFPMVASGRVRTSIMVSISSFGGGVGVISVVVSVVTVGVSGLFSFCV